MTDWRDVLDPADPEGSYRRLRSQHHPDHGGNTERFRQVQEAWERYLRAGRSDFKEGHGVGG